LIEAALKDDRAYAITRDLSTDIGPRLAGTEAEARARDWAVARLTQEGFTNARVETFPLTAWERIIETATIVGPHAQRLEVHPTGGSPSTPAEGIVGEVVRFADMAALRAAALGSLTGKIAFVDDIMPVTEDASGYGKAVRSRTEGPSVAGSLGAVGVVIRSIGTSKNRIAHTGTLSYNVSAPRIPAVAISNPDADALERQIAQTRPEGKAAGQQVTVRMRVTSRDLPQVRSANVIGDIPGTDLADEIVLIGAHLDTWDVGHGVQDDGAVVAIAIAE
jgi:hypothetical protein